ncbi:MAG: hypothetical protein CMJ83_02945 [Planctomycetes bacterium]|nr:hypothetical protein [Planctomycetota bacterium]
MNRSDDLDLLSDYLDGELTPTREEIVRLRLDEETELSKLYDRLRSMSDDTRAFFDAEERKMPDVATNQEDFIRTTLAGESLTGSLGARSGIRWKATAAAVVVIAVVVTGFVIRENEVRARRFKDAVEAALEPKHFVTIQIARPSLLPGRRPPVNLLYGRGGRWVIEAQDRLFVPPAFTPNRRGGLIRHRGKRIHFGSDGSVAWLWLEGSEVVRVMKLDGPVPIVSFLRSFLDEDPSGRQATPLLNWAKVQDVLEGVRSGVLEYRRVGTETIDNQRLDRYDVTLENRATARVWISTQDAAVRRVKIGLLDLRFDEPREVPEDPVFHWSSRAPADVRVIDVTRD